MIKPSHQKRFIDNLREFNSYFIARKKVDISNTDRLIGLIKLYYETLLCYKKISIGKNQVIINGKTYQSEINGTDINGQNIKLSFDQIGENLLTNILNDLKKILNQISFAKYINVSNEIIESRNIDINYKVYLLNAEGKSFSKQWQYLLFDIREDIAIKSIEYRKKIIFNYLKQPSNLLEGIDKPNLFIKSVYDSYEFLVKSAIRVFIYNNHFDEIFKYIYKEFDDFLDIPDGIELNDNRIVFFLLRSLILNNNLFQIENQEFINNYVSDKFEFLSKRNKDLIESDLNFSLADLELNNASIELAEPEFKGVDLNKITTFITFTIPDFRIDSFIKLNIRKSITLEIKNVNNPYDDPIFRFLDDLELAINSFPLTIFSDSIGSTNNAVNLSFIIKDFYHPDFILENNKLVQIDFTEKEAKIGRKYYPHKEYIIELLRGLKKESKLPLNIDLEMVNINLFSNYYVSYHDENNNIIYHKIHTITNLDSYINTKQRFLTKLSELNLSEESTDIRNLIFEYDIINTATLNTFIQRLIHLVVKKAIELRGINKNLWVDSIPVKETGAQPIIFNLIKSIGEIKGIQISREIVASNGSLDFHCSYTFKGKLLKSCIELKNAHHSKIIHGINSQLPQYIRDEGQKHGIFLVLWYKNKDFIKPEKYDTIDELKEDLIKFIPRRMNIKIEIIDCTIKSSPSKK